MAAHYQATLRDRSGETIPAAQLSVYPAGTTVLQPLFADDALTIPASNPFVADLRGRVDFYLVPAKYDLVARRHGFEEFKFLNVDITDIATAPQANLAGDVTGTTAASVVERIRGRVVESGAPVNAEVLTWNSGANQILWTLPPSAVAVDRVFIPSYAFRQGDDSQAATGNTPLFPDDVGGASGNYNFVGGGWFLPENEGTIMLSSSFYMPSAWFGQTVDIDVWATSGSFFPGQARVRVEIGNLAVESTQNWNPEDEGGIAIEIVSAATVDNGADTGQIDNRNFQGIRVGIVGDHVDTTSGIVLLGCLIRLN